MMVTRIPPMIAVEPTAFDEHTTILEGSSDSDVTQKRTISMRPILYYSYEGQVAVQGIITILPTRVPPQASKFNQGMQSLMIDTVWLVIFAGKNFAQTSSFRNYLSVNLELLS